MNSNKIFIIYILSHYSIETLYQERNSNKKSSYFLNIIRHTIFTYINGHGNRLHNGTSVTKRNYPFIRDSGLVF